MVVFCNARKINEVQYPFQMAQFLAVVLLFFSFAAMFIKLLPFVPFSTRRSGLWFSQAVRAPPGAAVPLGAIDVRRTQGEQETCPDKVKHAIAQLGQIIQSDEVCTGPRNRRVCDPIAFRKHFAPGNIDAARAHDWKNRAFTNMTKTRATPWLTIGDFAFTGNDYLDFYVYWLFFRERAEVGTYAEMGGSNGVYASNTYFLDHALGWSGALIEPTACAVCQMPFNRPRATNINAGVCQSSEIRDFSFMSKFCRRGQSSGCNFDYEHVPCEPMDALFSKGGLAHIDFFSLDIETEFRTAFNTIDFNKTHISVFLMECNAGKTKHLKECERMMADKGYEFAWVTFNDILGWKPEVRPAICS